VIEYRRSRYTADDTTAIMAYEDGVPYCTCSVNLSEYGMYPPEEDYIFVPTYNMFSFYEKFKNDLVEEEICQVPIGFGFGMLVRLKENWKEIAKEL